MKRTQWFDRTFAAIADNGQLPGIIERLAGTPARAEEITRTLPADFTCIHVESKWSIREEIGHLDDLEGLWSGRIEDFHNRLQELRAADLSNAMTNAAGHNNRPVEEILKSFRRKRSKLVDVLWKSTDRQLLFSSLHPRLKTPMRLIDHAFFIAEHDDHHLARIREIIIFNN